MKHRNTLISVFVLMPLVVGLIGCVGVRGFPQPPRTSTAAPPDPDYLLGQEALKRYGEEEDVATKKILRNEIIDARMEEIDLKFGDFERELFKQDVGFGIGTDWVVLGLTATAAVVGGADTKAALAAAAAAVVGAQAAFDKRALFDKTLPVLMAQMVAQRETIRTSIRTSEELPVESYSLYSGLSDLQRFEFAGSIPGSLQSIAEDAGQKTKTAADDLKNLRQGKYLKSNDGDLLEKYWKPDGKTIDATNEAKLKDWMKTQGLETGSGAITMFINSGALQDLRKQAVQFLGLK